MTNDEEKALLGTIDNLMKIVENVQQGQLLMTDAFVMLEKRMNKLDGKPDKASKLILPNGLGH